MIQSITVCIPAFNESKNLEGLFKSIYESDINNYKYEILLCDSNSSDDTELLALKWGNYLNIRLLTTEGANASQNLNTGISQANGDIFVRLDARSRISRNYFKVGCNLLVENQNKYCAIGPTLDPYSPNNGAEAECMAAFFRSPLLMGPTECKKSYFHQRFEGTVSTIYLGFFWLHDLKSINGFDPQKQRKQDIDLLSRLVNKTDKTLFCSHRCNVDYKLNHNSVKEMGNRAYIQGVALTNDPMNTRPTHFVPILAFFISLGLLFSNKLIVLLLFFIYLICVCIFGFLERKRASSIYFALITFPFVHLNYIAGNFVGLIKRL